MADTLALGVGPAILTHSVNKLLLPLATRSILCDMGPAGVGREAEVDTGALVAALGGFTVSVRGPLHLVALLLGAALKSLWAEADRPVAGHTTFGGGSTVGGGDHSLALAGDTVLGVAAVLPPDTAR